MFVYLAFFMKFNLKKMLICSTSDFEIVQEIQKSWTGREYLCIRLLFLLLSDHSVRTVQNRYRY
jgi:hypothetical protein